MTTNRNRRFLCRSQNAPRRPSQVLLPLDAAQRARSDPFLPFCTPFARVPAQARPRHGEESETAVDELPSRPGRRADSWRWSTRKLGRNAKALYKSKISVGRRIGGGSSRRPFGASLGGPFGAAKTPHVVSAVRGACALRLCPGLLVSLSVCLMRPK